MGVFLGWRRRDKEFGQMCFLGPALSLMIIMALHKSLYLSSS